MTRHSADDHRAATSEFLGALRCWIPLARRLLNSHGLLMDLTELITGAATSTDTYVCRRSKDPLWSGCSTLRELEQAACRLSFERYCLSNPAFGSSELTPAKCAGL